MRIGLLSDTHNYLDPELQTLFKGVDEIWHAGDFGSFKIAKELESIAPLVGVYGNIDGQDIRGHYPLHQRFEREGLDIWMTHIGGVPGRYCLPIREEIKANPPDVFVCGHSHILKIARDNEHGGMLTINPGAAGKQGFQVHRTVLRFTLSNKKISEMEVVHLQDELHREIRSEA